MATRKAKRKAAPKAAARRSPPRTSATKVRAPQAAPAPAVAIEVKPPEPVEVKPAGTVEVDGCKTTRHYEDGKHSVLTHNTPEAAQEYADSLKGDA